MTAKNAAEGLAVLGNMALVESQTGAGLPGIPAPPKNTKGDTAEVEENEAVEENVTETPAEDAAVQLPQQDKPEAGKPGDAPAEKSSGAGERATSTRKPRTSARRTPLPDKTSVLTKRTSPINIKVSPALGERLALWEFHQKQSREPAVRADLLEELIDGLRDRDMVDLAKWVNETYEPQGRAKPGQGQVSFAPQITDDHRHRLDLFLARMLIKGMKVPLAAAIAWMLDRSLPTAPDTDGNL